MNLSLLHRKFRLLAIPRRSDKKDSAATAARLKGNRFFKAKQWEKALELYMTSLKARPYAINTLANVAQVRAGWLRPARRRSRGGGVTGCPFKLGEHFQTP